MNKDKYLIMQLGRFGDLILFTPAFRLIKEKYPNIELHLLAGRKNYEVVLANPYIDRIIKFDKSPSKIFATIYNIRKDYYKYWIDPRDHFSTESRILGKIARAENKIGFNEAHKERIFNIDIKTIDKIIHHSLIGVNALDELGIRLPDSPIRPELFFWENEQFSKTTNNIVSQNSKYIVLNLSASGEHKMWQVDKWIEFVKQTGIYKQNLVVNFMPRDYAQAQSIKSAFPEIILHQPSNIRDVMAITAYCDYVITPDTSIVHIAAAFNKSIFALYSNSDFFYNKFYPLSDDFVVIRSKDGDNGLHSIEVADAVDNFLKKFIKK